MVFSFFGIEQLSTAVREKTESYAKKTPEKIRRYLFFGPDRK